MALWLRVDWCACRLICIRLPAAVGGLGKGFVGSRVGCFSFTYSAVVSCTTGVFPFRTIRSTTLSATLHHLLYGILHAERQDVHNQITTRPKHIVFLPTPPPSCSPDPERSAHQQPAASASYVVCLSLHPADNER